MLDPSNGRVIAMASYPTYDPSVWVGGITSRQLSRLYSQASGEPLLSRPTQGQLAPGSTFKPFSTAGALTHGYSTSTQLECSSSYTVGGRTFKNYESAALRLPDVRRGAAAVLRHVLLPDRLRQVAAGRARTPTT